MDSFIIPGDHVTLHCSYFTVTILQGINPPLYGASEFGRVHIIRHLIQRGADVNLTTDVRFSVTIMHASIVCTMYVFIE